MLESDILKTKRVLFWILLINLIIILLSAFCCRDFVKINRCQAIFTKNDLLHNVFIWLLYDCQLIVSSSAVLLFIV